MEIDDLANVLELAGQLSGQGSDYWTDTRETLEKLKADSSYVLGLTIDLPTAASTGPMHNLPVPDFDETGFFGRKAQVARIKKIVRGPYPVVSILGDGGIGKTSVALKVAYELLDDPSSKFDSIVWVTAKATVLSANEIRRVSDAIEDSLGLFVRAADELGGDGATKDPVEEVLAYLETFRVLLILDNLETVLDTRLRDFLLDLPLGSKVILTSRIGAGVENPVQLEPLTDDESHQLLRTVARIREVTAVESLGDPDLRNLASKIAGHPLYIKWFVSGVQAGRRPEELLSDNSLLLDFCMSNVYEFLHDDAQSVLQCMQVLPDEKRQAEVAFLVSFDAQTAQSALLQLLTTNFVHMESQTQHHGLETTYQLSEFGRTYLDKQHPVSSERRRVFLERYAEMREMGWRLQAENTASPYDSHTVNVRDSGDFSTARLLRDAITALERAEYDEALGFCREAQVLSPMYSESWRVEALVQAALPNVNAARTAFERAVELDPGSATLNFLFGTFLSEARVDVDGAVRYLRKAAQLDRDNPYFLGSLSWALLEAGHSDDAAATAARVVNLRAPDVHAAPSLIVGLRAHSFLLESAVSSGHLYRALEGLEAASEIARSAWREILVDESIDRLVQLRSLASSLQGLLEAGEDEYRIAKTAEFVALFDAKIESTGIDTSNRRIGTIKTLVGEKGYGFIGLEHGADYFFHIRNMASESEWPYLEAGARVAFTLNAADSRGLRAVDVRWLS